jgi:putative redox protein
LLKAPERHLLTFPGGVSDWTASREVREASEGGNVMVNMSVIYKGEKHCELTHGPSGSKIETDAPKDNQGLGAAFSPTDLVGAALASCILTTIALMAERDGIDIKGSTANVSKGMSLNPRRISDLPVEIKLPKSLKPEDRKRLEAAGHSCPVHHSLHPDVKAPITFIYA